MAYTTIKKSSDYFNTVLYTGNGSTQSITGVGFQPDMLWGKDRSTITNHELTDVVRGINQRLKPNDIDADQTNTTTFTSFDSDGFTVGNNGDVNTNGSNQVVWSWLADNTSGSANTDGSISSTVSANTTSGFSIVSWTGNGGTASVGHGLGVKPNIVIKKNRGASTNWIFSTTIIDGSNDFFYLNSTNAKGNSGETAPTASLINLYANSENNGNGNGMIAYCFAEKQGYSKFGSYTGNGSTDGTFVYTGFKPAFLMVKNAAATGSWILTDTTRSTFNITSHMLQANASAAETTDAYFDILSNGFKVRSTSSYVGHAVNYIYMAFAEEPLVGDNPATAR